jgi:hypothetical protein
MAELVPAIHAENTNNQVVSATVFPWLVIANRRGCLWPNQRISPN